MSLSYFSLVYYKRNAVLNIARVVYWDRLGAVPSREDEEANQSVVY